MYGPPVGASLEHLVLTNSKPYYKNYKNFPPHSRPVYPNQYQNNATNKWRNAAAKVGSAMVKKKEAEEEEEEASGSNCCNKKLCWWSPSQDLVAVAFCNETSIHGFKFMGQLKRHMTERY